MTVRCARRAGATTVLLISVLAGSGCELLPFQECESDLRWSYSPDEATLPIGESFTAEAKAFGCGGTERLDVDMRWSSDNRFIASVDSMTGRVTAQSEGTTTIVGEDLGRYGIGPVAIPVTVTHRVGFFGSRRVDGRP